METNQPKPKVLTIGYVDIIDIEKFEQYAEVISLDVDEHPFSELSDLMIGCDFVYIGALELTSQFMAVGMAVMAGKALYGDAHEFQRFIDIKYPEIYSEDADAFSLTLKHYVTP